MDIGNVLKELGVKSSLLWGLAIGSGVLLVLDGGVSPLGIPADWKWLLPVTAVISWAILLSGLIAIAAPAWTRVWTRQAAERKRAEYAVKNLATAGNFERAVLLHYKAKGQQRFRARRDADAFHQMARHGFIVNDSLDAYAYMQHYKIADSVWKFLDAPPDGWGRGAVLQQINWE
jgi:hypothetical protein